MTDTPKRYVTFTLSEEERDLLLQLLRAIKIDDPGPQRGVDKIASFIEQAPFDDDRSDDAEAAASLRRGIEASREAGIVDSIRDITGLLFHTLREAAEANNLRQLVRCSTKVYEEYRTVDLSRPAGTRVLS